MIKNTKLLSYHKRFLRIWALNLSIKNKTHSMTLKFLNAFSLRAFSLFVSSLEFLFPLNWIEALEFRLAWIRFSFLSFSSKYVHFYLSFVPDIAHRSSLYCLSGGKLALKPDLRPGCVCAHRGSFIKGCSQKTLLTRGVALDVNF